MTYRDEIDGLRAIAVMAVVCFHYSIYFLFSGGFVGVDVFFVISGYLITRIINDQVEEKRFSLAVFYERRIKRIFPALYVVYLFCLISSYLVGFGAEAEFLGESIKYSVFFVSNVLFYNTSSYFDSKSEVNPVLHTWSLSVEEQFYVLFPLIIYLISFIGRKARAYLMFFMVVSSFVVSVIYVEMDSVGAFYLVQYRAWEFLLGAILALDLVPKIEVKWQVEFLAVLGLVLILIGVVFYSNKTKFPGYAALLPCVGAFLVIYTSGIRKTFAAKLLAIKILRYIGKASYSIYLWHWPLLIFARQYIVFDYKGKFILIFICMIVSFISWRFIELPFRKRAVGNINVFLGGAALVMLVMYSFSMNFSDIKKQYNPALIEAEKLLSFTDYKDDMRAGDCFLTSEFNEFSFYKKDFCLQVAKDKKNVLLIGDSHAAHLVPGLSSVFPEINFMQATASGCHPVLSARGEKRCLDLMNYIFNSYLKENSVDVVILSARWVSDDVPRAIDTARWVRQFVSKVVIFGPIVEYDLALPRLLARAKADGVDSETFVGPHRKTEQYQIDQYFMAQSYSDNISYVSVYSLMQKPFWHLYADGGIPMQFDYGHLTTEGAKILVKSVGLKAYGG